MCLFDVCNQLVTLRLPDVVMEFDAVASEMVMNSGFVFISCDE